MPLMGDNIVIEKWVLVGARKKDTNREVLIDEIRTVLVVNSFSPLKKNGFIVESLEENLWEGLMSISNGISLSSLVLGDFNVVLSREEPRNGQGLTKVLYNGTWLLQMESTEVDFGVVGLFDHFAMVVTVCIRKLKKVKWILKALKAEHYSNILGRMEVVPKSLELCQVELSKNMMNVAFIDNEYRLKGELAYLLNTKESFYRQSAI
ncbi:hypothetical protein Ancab_010991 [Ancistrocladus abbreviatus]